MGPVSCRACKGSGAYYTKSGKRLDCKACNGSGINYDLYETSCERCRAPIVYRKDGHAPRFCKDCKGVQLEKTCAQYGCTNTIRYHVGWDNVPDYCKRCETKRNEGWSASTCPGTGFFGCGKLIWSPPGKKFSLCPDCSARKKADDQSHWHEKKCPGLKGESYCGNIIKYRDDWERVPDICPECRDKAKRAKADREAKMREKPCAGGCGATIKYSIDWEHPPNYCKDCKERQKSFQPEKVFWPPERSLPGSSRSLRDLKSSGITGASIKTNAFGGYHVTLFNRDERYSYDTDSNNNLIPGRSHYTDEAAKLLGIDTIGPDATNKNRW